MNREADLRRLLHDVGKYVSRTAKNVRPGEPVPEVLVTMLAKDLYELDDGRRASAVFGERAAGLGDDERLGRVRTLLEEADRIEPALRAGAPDAVRRGAEIGRGVEELLRELVRSETTR